MICQETTAVTNRDSVLSVEYEYRNGFDATFWVLSEVERNDADGPGEINSVVIENQEVTPGGGGETPTETDYEKLMNLPLINGVRLIGDKSAEELDLIGEIENTEILRIWNAVMTDF